MTDPLDGLRIHTISGWEWECGECHFHIWKGIMPDDLCAVCERQITEAEDGEYVDSAGALTNHDELVSLAAVKELLSKQP